MEIARYSKETRSETTSKDMDICHLEEIYLPNMENNYSILLQKQD